MQITEVKVFPVRDKKLRAFASIVLDGVFMVNDIKVIEGKDGFFISMPSRRKKNGRFKDIAHPLNQETRRLLEETIIAEYRRVAEGNGSEQPAAEGDGDDQPVAAPEPPAVVPAAAPDPAPRTFLAPEAQQEKSSEADDKSLEEVAEEHLSDSYWTT
jgi:stage V sporulation protein G